MKLYLFSTSCWGKPKLTMEEFEVEEKPKSYVCNGRRFNKDNIGHVSGYSNDECLLLENNPSKACEILLIQKEKELREIEERLSRKKAEIENLKNYIRTEGTDNE